MIVCRKYNDNIITCTETEIYMVFLQHFVGCIFFIHNNLLYIAALKFHISEHLYGFKRTTISNIQKCYKTSHMMWCLSLGDSCDLLMILLIVLLFFLLLLLLRCRRLHLLFPCNCPYSISYNPGYFLCQPLFHCPWNYWSIVLSIAVIGVWCPWTAYMQWNDVVVLTECIFHLINHLL